MSALRAEFCPPWPDTLPAPLTPHESPVADPSLGSHVEHVLCCSADAQTAFSADVVRIEVRRVRVSVNIISRWFCLRYFQQSDRHSVLLLLSCVKFLAHIYASYASTFQYFSRTIDTAGRYFSAVLAVHDHSILCRLITGYIWIHKLLRFMLVFLFVVLICMLIDLRCCVLLVYYLSVILCFPIMQDSIC